MYGGVGSWEAGVNGNREDGTPEVVCDTRSPNCAVFFSPFSRRSGKAACKRNAERPSAPKLLSGHDTRRDQMLMTDPAVARTAIKEERADRVKCFPSLVPPPPPHRRHSYHPPSSAQRHVRWAWSVPRD